LEAEIEVSWDTPVNCGLPWNVGQLAFAGATVGAELDAWLAAVAASGVRMISAVNAAILTASLVVGGIRRRWALPFFVPDTGDSSMVVCPGIIAA
jgi:hypothetical protein